MKSFLCSLIAGALLSASVLVSAAGITAENGIISATDVPDGSALITALFRGGQMIDVTYRMGSGTMTVELSETFETMEDTDTVKAFLWDMDVMQPLCAAVAITNTEQTDEDNKMNILINGQTFLATLYDNETAKAFRNMLPMTMDMSELNGNEKYCYLDSSLPTNSLRPGTIHEGDLMLYGASCFVLFYDTFQSAYSYTPIGRIEDTAGLKHALGSGAVTVRFE